MKILGRTLLLCSAGIVAIVTTNVEAQGNNTIGRRVERAARQLQRQVNQADYYTPQTWQQLDPWVQQNRIAPWANAAQAARNVANATGNQQVQPGNAVQLGVNSQYGYRANAAANNWFYDYYTYTPTWYNGQSDDRYASAIRYFDSDNDGDYDSWSHYRDSDNDGRYDEFDRFDFQGRTQTNTSERVVAGTEPEGDFARGPEDSRRYRVNGEIKMIKTVACNGDEHLMLGLKTDNVELLAVDIGSAAAMKNQNVEVGQTVVVIGTNERIGEKDVIVAESVQIGGGKMIEVVHNIGLTLTGEIVDVNKTRVGNAEHYIVVVEVDSERQLIDLGPVASYKGQLKPSNRITVRGVPVRSQDHRVIMAERVQLGDEVYKIDRTQSFKF